MALGFYALIPGYHSLEGQFGEAPVRNLGREDFEPDTRRLGVSY